MKARLLFIAIASLLITGLNSCKKCEVQDENIDKGEIIFKDVVIYPEIGYLSDDAGNHITGSSQYAQYYQVSFDNGFTKGDVDWSSYDILSCSMKIDCEASFERNVYYGPLPNMVTYEVTATTCSGCENQRIVENYVLVPKIPAGYTVVTDVTVNAQ